MLRGPARGRVGSGGAGGLGLLFFSVRCVPILDLPTFFFFLKLLFLQALSFCIVGLTLENLSAD